MPDAPNFGAWTHENLWKFAEEVYPALQAERQANEQLRLDLRDALNIIRNLNKGGTDGNTRVES